MKASRHGRGGDRNTSNTFIDRPGAMNIGGPWISAQLREKERRTGVPVEQMRARAGLKGARSQKRFGKSPTLAKLSWD